MISFSCNNKARWYMDPRHWPPHPLEMQAEAVLAPVGGCLRDAPTWCGRAEQPPGSPAAGFSQLHSQTWFPQQTIPNQDPSCSLHQMAPASPTLAALPVPSWPTGTHAGGEAVGGGGLVDLVGVGLGVGAPCRRLPLAAARGAAVHHAGLCCRLALLAGEGVALICHHPGQRDKDVKRGKATWLHTQTPPLPKNSLSKLCSPSYLGWQPLVPAHPRDRMRMGHPWALPG